MLIIESMLAEDGTGFKSPVATMEDKRFLRFDWRLKTKGQLFDSFEYHVYD